jgi:hypothetical protein
VATLRETITKITRNFIECGGIVAAQNIIGAGNLQNTFPGEYQRHENVLNLPTSDSSNAGVMCGIALTRRCMYVVRFGGLMWLNTSYLANYAAKSKELWGVPCPVFTRVMACENGIGPVCTGTFNGLAMRAPGLKVCSPMTPWEWETCWQEYLEGDDPVICNEHRDSYNNSEELYSMGSYDIEVPVFAIGPFRLKLHSLRQKLLNYCNISCHHVWRLKPLEIPKDGLSTLSGAALGVVVDSEHTTCGAGEHVANQLMLKTGKRVYTLGLEDRSAGFNTSTDNVTPSVEKVYEFIRGKILE